MKQLKVQFYAFILAVILPFTSSILPLKSSLLPFKLSHEPVKEYPISDYKDYGFDDDIPLKSHKKIHGPPYKSEHYDDFIDPEYHDEVYPIKAPKKKFDHPYEDEHFHHHKKIEPFDDDFYDDHKKVEYFDDDFHDSHKSLPSKLPGHGPCPDLQIFNSCFLKAVKKSPKLLELFDYRRISSNEGASGLFYVCTAESAAVRDKKSAHNSYLATRFINSCAPKLTHTIMVKVYSNALAKFLKSQGKLNAANACDLAHQLAQCMEAACDKYFQKCVARSRVNAIDMAVEDFLVAQKVIAAENTGELNFLFGLEFLELYDLKDSPESYPHEEYDYHHPQKPNCGVDFPLNKEICVSSPPAVTAFVTKYYKVLQFEPPKLPPEETSKGFFYLLHYYLARRQTAGSAGLAQYISELMLKNREIPLSQWRKAAIVGCAKYLHAVQCLTHDNVHELVHKLASFMKGNIHLIADPSHIQSGLVVMIKSMTEFLVALDAFGPDRGRKIIFFIGNEFKCLTHHISQHSRY